MYPSISRWLQKKNPRPLPSHRRPPRRGGKTSDRHKNARPSESLLTWLSGLYVLYIFGFPFPLLPPPPCLPGCLPLPLMFCRPPLPKKGSCGSLIVWVFSSQRGFLVVSPWFFLSTHGKEKTSLRSIPVRYRVLTPQSAHCTAFFCHWGIRHVRSAPSLV